MSIDKCITAVNCIAHNHREKEDLQQWAKEARTELADLCRDRKRLRLLESIAPCSINIKSLTGQHRDIYVLRDFTGTSIHEGKTLNEAIDKAIMEADDEISK